MGTWYTNGTVLTADGQLQKIDLLVDDGRIKQMKKAYEQDLFNGQSAGQRHAVNQHDVIHCDGLTIIPALIDAHVHLREPGFEEKETVATGTKAAVKGGFSSVACMPNTNPPLDMAQTIDQLLHTAQQEAYARVWPIGAITMGQRGETLTNVEQLRHAGIVALSDDGVGVQTAGMMKKAMEQAVVHNIPIVAHCEDNSLLDGGSVHDGVFAQKHGVQGISSASEYMHVARDVLLAEETGARYHVCHISTKESVRIIREAKARGAAVTAEVSPHHLLLNEEDIPGLDPQYKMNPPLRSKEDQQALIEGLLDGTIDMIATDHAPHTAEEKQKSLDESPFGIVGLETALPLLYTHFVRTGRMSLAILVEKLTVHPARLLNIDFQPIATGNRADFVVVDLETKQNIDAHAFASKGTNTPFNGWCCQGWPVRTVIDGVTVWSGETGFCPKNDRPYAENGTNTVYGLNTAFGPHTTVKGEKVYDSETL